MLEGFKTCFNVQLSRHAQKHHCKLLCSAFVNRESEDCNSKFQAKWSMERDQTL